VKSGFLKRAASSAHGSVSRVRHASSAHGSISRVQRVYGVLSQLLTFKKNYTSREQLVTVREQERCACPLAVSLSIRPAVSPLAGLPRKKKRRPLDLWVVLTRKMTGGSPLVVAFAKSKGNKAPPCHLETSLRDIYYTNLYFRLSLVGHRNFKFLDIKINENSQNACARNRLGSKIDSCALFLVLETSLT